MGDEKDGLEAPSERPLHYQIPLNYLEKPEPLLRSWFGVWAFIVVLVAGIPELGLMLVAAGVYMIKHDPTGDPGGPLFILMATAFTLALAIAFAVLWLLAVALMLVGLMRTRGRCWWSRVAGIILVVLLIGAVLIWNIVR